MQNQKNKNKKENVYMNFFRKNNKMFNHQVLLYQKYIHQDRDQHDVNS